MSYFPEIPVIRFEGPATDNPLAFRHYNATEKVGNKTMAEHLRFAAAYWHVMIRPTSRVGICVLEKKGKKKKQKSLFIQRGI
jgi:xylose isomerase